MSSERWNAGPGQTVLIVEDDQLIREIIAETFREKGFAVLEDESAEAAMELLAQDVGVGLLVTDIRLAGELTGLDLAHWAINNRPDLRVLAISGLNNEAIASSHPTRYSFLKKPFQPDDLLDRAHTLLSDRC